MTDGNRQEYAWARLPGVYPFGTEDRVHQLLDAEIELKRHRHHRHASGRHAVKFGAANSPK